MTSALPIHVPAGVVDRIAVIDLLSNLADHVPWLESSFPAGDFADHDRQRAVRAELARRVEGLAGVLDEAASAVRHGRAVVLRGLPAESTAMVVAVTSAVGPVVATRPDRPLIDDLAPKPGGDDGCIRLGDLRVALTPHTDNSTMTTPPEVLVLAFVYNSDPTGGGESTLTHIDDVAAALDGADVELLRDKRYPSLNVPTDARLVPTVTSVLDRRADGCMTVRYRDEALTAGVASERAPVTPSPAHVDALARFTERVRDRNLQTRVRLDTGCVLMIDNARFLHGRTEISPNVPRHLKRLYTRLSW
jgi:alpha-ketoglutarate-dependent taurine dioxygenase